jgi:hypothetical protein
MTPADDEPPRVSSLNTDSYDHEDPADAARLDAIAEAQIDAGEAVDNERVRDWLLGLAPGRYTPPPKQ